MRDVTVLVAGVHCQVVDARLCEDVLLKVKTTHNVGLPTTSNEDPLSASILARDFWWICRWKIMLLMYRVILKQKNKASGHSYEQNL